MTQRVLRERQRAVLFPAATLQHCAAGVGSSVAIGAPGARQLSFKTMLARDQNALVRCDRLSEGLWPPRVALAVRTKKRPRFRGPEEYLEKTDYLISTTCVRHPPSESGSPWRGCRSFSPMLP